MVCVQMMWFEYFTRRSIRIILLRFAITASAYLFKIDNVAVAMIVDVFSLGLSPDLLFCYIITQKTTEVELVIVLLLGQVTRWPNVEPLLAQRIV